MKHTMPLQVWVLTLCAFAIGTAEFVIAGILTQVADSLAITDGKAGNLITAYALAIVIGGPILTLCLARFDKSRVLIGLMVLFVGANLVSAFSTDYTVLMVSRVLAGLTQGPFYGIGAVVATRLVPENMAGRAVGQMFAGLTLANVLGVPGGAWIGTQFDWHTTFLVVAALGAMAIIALWVAIPYQGKEENKSLGAQMKAFGNWSLIASLLITTLAWTGFMNFYGYIAPIAEDVSGFARTDLTWILVIVGIGLVIGNGLGGKTADINLRFSLLFWPLAMIGSLVLVGITAHMTIVFIIAAFIFGVASFSNVPPMQMRVMKYSAQAPELAATANISAFNIANALGGIIGGAVVDSSYGASMVPFFALIVPLIGWLFILSQEWRRPTKGTA